MSDGPYRSLKLGKKWKSAARAAEREASDKQEVADQFCEALQEDLCSDEVQRVVQSIKEVISDAQRDMFPVDRLLEIRLRASGNAFATGLVDNLVALAENFDAETSVKQAFEASVDELWDRQERHIEEHYQQHREATGPMKVRIRDRLTDAKSMLPMAALTDCLYDGKRTLAFSSGNRSGLDDGPAL